MADISTKHKAKTAMMCMTRQCWEQGIAAQALLEIRDDEDLALCVRDIVLRQSEDGRLCNIENTPAVTDSSFCIPATLAVGEKNRNGKYLEAVRKNIEYLRNEAPRTQDNVICHMLGTKEIWADSAAFLPYALSITGYPEDAMAQMRGLLRKLYDPESGLYYHKWDEKSREYQRKLFWGIGNGWILTGLLRLCLALPVQYEAERQELLTAFRSLLDVMLKYETENHLFHDVLDDSGTFEETEVSEMAAYAIFLAVREGLLDRTYLDRALKIREAVIAKVSDRGLLRDCASSPEFIKPGTSVEGQAHFLMMEKAFENLNNFM